MDMKWETSKNLSKKSLPEDIPHILHVFSHSKSKLNSWLRNINFVLLLLAVFGIVSIAVPEKNIFDTSPVLKTIDQPSKFFRFALYALSPTTQIVKAQDEVDVSTTTAQNYMHVIWKVLQFVADTWDPKLSRQLSQDGQFMSSVGKRKYNKGKPKKISKYCHYRIGDTNPNVKGNYSHVTRVIETENTFKSVQTGMYYYVEEWSVIDCDKGANYVARVIRERFITRGVAHSSGIYSDPKTITKRYHERITSNRSENGNIEDKIEARIRKGFGPITPDEKSAQNWVNLLDYRNNHTNKSATDCLCIFLYALAQYQKTLP